MSDNNKTFATVLGIVQQFGDNPVINTREVAGQTIREFTVKSAVSEKLVRITLWPEYSAVDVAHGAFVAAEGALTVNKVQDKTYYNLNPKTLVVTPPVPRAEKGVVNAKAADDTTSF